MANNSLPNRNPLRKICSVPDCPSLVRSRNLCVRHYDHWLRFGDTKLLRNMGYGKTQEERFWSRVDKTPGLGPQGECWEWQAFLSKGYGAMHWDKARKKVHVISFFLAQGRWPNPGLMVRHKCDNRSCVNPAHLLEGTAADNSSDMISRGRQLLGEMHPQAKLTESDVAQALRWSNEGLSQQEIARRFGVSHGTIGHIFSGKNWKHLLIAELRGEGE